MLDLIFKTHAETCMIDLYGLTKKERRVMRYLYDKLSTPEIAKSLGVSECTIKFHLNNILKKTKCRSRLEVMVSLLKSCAERTSAYDFSIGKSPINEEEEIFEKHIILPQGRPM